MPSNYHEIEIKMRLGVVLGFFLVYCIPRVLGLSRDAKYINHRSRL